VIKLQVYLLLLLLPLLLLPRVAPSLTNAPGYYDLVTS
jgi:hypothetical protein